MATRLYAWNPGETRVLEGVGAAASSKVMNLTVDIATDLINEGTTTRVLDRAEVLKFLDEVKEHILRGSWPPA